MIVFMANPFTFSFFGSVLDYFICEEFSSDAHNISLTYSLFFIILLGPSLFALVIYLDEKSFKKIFEMNHSSVIDDRDLIVEMVSQDEITEKDQIGSYNTTKSAFKVSKVSKAFIKNDKNMIHNLSFNLDKHQVMGILGPSGAGKSTIFKIMTMALRRDSGEISVLGNDFSNP